MKLTPVKTKPQCKKAQRGQKVEHVLYTNPDFLTSSEQRGPLSSIYLLSSQTINLNIHIEVDL